MKVVKALRKLEDAKEMYKVGNVIYDEAGYYLIVTSNEGYALVNLSNNSVFMEKDSLSELEEAARDDSDRRVNAELRILE